MSSQSPPAAATPRAICAPRPGAPSVQTAPALSAMSRVLSREPPSERTSSRISPASSPSPSAPSVAGRPASASSTGMMTEIGARMIGPFESVAHAYITWRKQRGGPMSRKVYQITGSDRTEFLQGLVTSDVTKLKDGLVYTAMLTPQGKYIADFFLVPADEAILLDVDAELGPDLVQRLTMYKLRSDVQIEETALHVHRDVTSRPQDAFADPRSDKLGWRAYRETPQEDEETTDWEALRVANGIPAPGRELTPDSFILEMGFERLNGVDFKKGCYVGQEVTARMKHKTELRKGLAQVAVEGRAPVGSEIVAGEKAAGTLFTQAAGQGLAYLRFDRASDDMRAEDAVVRYSPA